MRNANMAPHHVAPSEPAAGAQYLDSTVVGCSQACAVDHDHAMPHGHETDSDDDYDEDWPSPLDYARYYGLTTSYFDTDPLQSDFLPSPSGDFYSDLGDPELAPNLDLLASLAASNESAIHEKWDIDKDAGVFLASVVKSTNIEAAAEFLEANGMLGFGDLKLEEPLLASDPELDLLRLKRRNTVIISAHGLEPFVINEQKGEGLSWAMEELQLVAEKERELGQEKLDVDHSTRQFLKEVMSSQNSTGEESIQISDDQAKVNGLHHASSDFANCVKLSDPLPVSPLLMPLSPPFCPTGLSSLAAEVPFTSIPEDPTINEGAKLDQQILSRDAILSDPTTAASITDPNTMGASAPLRSISKSSSSFLERARSVDLKAEVPLTPQELDEGASRRTKSVAFPPDLQAMLPEPESSSSSFNSNNAMDSVNHVVAKFAKPYADSAIQAVMDEQLDELDTTMRVSIPSN